MPLDDEPISNLPVYASPQSGDLIPILDIATLTTKRITFANLINPSNGLTMDSGLIKLGGPLTSNTTIDVVGYNLTITGSVVEALTNNGNSSSTGYRLRVVDTVNGEDKELNLTRDKTYLKNISTDGTMYFGYDGSGSYSEWKQTNAAVTYRSTLANYTLGFFNGFSFAVDDLASGDLTQMICAFEGYSLSYDNFARYAVKVDRTNPNGEGIFQSPPTYAYTTNADTSNGIIGVNSTGEFFRTGVTAAQLATVVSAGGTIKGAIAATTGLVPFGTGVADTVTSSSNFIFNTASNQLQLNRKLLVGATTEVESAVSIEAINGFYVRSSSTANTQVMGTSISGGYANFFATYYGSSSYLPMKFRTSDTDRILIATNGNVNILKKTFLGGTTTPTAHLHLAAGTTAVPSKKSEVGVLNTTATGGSEEYNNSFYQTKNSGLRYGQGGVIFQKYKSTGNATTVETDLHTYTTPASTLADNGSSITYTIGGSFVSSATATRQLKIYFGGTAIFDSGALTLSLSSAWSISCEIIRVSSTVIRYNVRLNTEGASSSAYVAVGELTGLTLSSTNILKITGTAAGVGAASDDILLKMAVGKWFPVAAN